MNSFFHKPKINFLIIRLSSLGDVILTTKLIRCLKNKYPISNIDFLVNKQFVDVIKHNPYINNIYEFDKNNWQQIKKIKNNLEQNTFIIDLQNNIKSKIIIWKINKPAVKFNKKTFRKIAFVWFKLNIMPKKSIPDRYIDALQKLDVISDSKGIEVWLSEENNNKLYSPDYKKKITKNKLQISIAPSAKHKTKQWLPEYFIELINKISNKYNCVFDLLGGEDAIEICNAITKTLNKDVIINDHSGKTTILDVVRIVDKADILISNDTGILHIGAARKIPIVALYGSSVYEFGFAPYGTPYIICEIELGCRPCSHIGKNNCSKEHFNCMSLLTPDFVYENFEKLTRQEIQYENN